MTEPNEQGVTETDEQADPTPPVPLPRDPPPPPGYVDPIEQIEVLEEGL